MPENKPAAGSTKDGTAQLKLLLILVLCVAIVVPLASSMFTIKSVSEKIAKLNAGNQSEGDAKPEQGPMVFYEPMEFLVNLSDTEVSHYLRTTVSLGSHLTQEEIEQQEKKGGGHGGNGEGPVPALFHKIKSQEPVIRDVVISVVSNYPMTALVSAAGKRELKETLTGRLKTLLETDNIAVYFTAFTLQ